MSDKAASLPLWIESATRANLLQVLEPVRGCLKATSMLWMRALGLPVLSGIVVNGWSKDSAAALNRFCKQNDSSSILLRIDKRHDRWTRRRGGYILHKTAVPGVVKELKREGMLALLLEPASPYCDAYSFAAVTVPEESKIVIEVIGAGFDASDILRGDIQPHERWNIGLGTNSRREHSPRSFERISLATTEQYTRSVQQRLTKIGARTKNPAFPGAELDKYSAEELAEAGTAYLKDTRQTLLLKNASRYTPVPEKHIVAFARSVENLLAGLAGYGIHLGSSSFAASLIPKRGLTFWDFFPARRQEAASLYPGTQKG